MKIVRRTTVSKSKYGKIIFSNNNLEDHERDTILIVDVFSKTREMYRIMVIQDDDNLLDIFK